MEHNDLIISLIQLLKGLQMTDIILAFSAIMTAFATIAIACFTKTNIELTKSNISISKATNELSKAVQDSSEKYQEDMKKLHIDLVAAALVAAVNPLAKPLRTELLDEMRNIVKKSQSV